tara:strand:+ start:293 stop:490 length:198 start_codon:yes stop_codon:yes gene_type:complete
MVFHGDYEVDFEIYEKREDDWRSQLLGYMTGIDSEDAKTRWMEAHEISDDRIHRIHAVPTLAEWK